MDSFELDSFVEELKTSKALLLQMEAAKTRLAVMGMRYIGSLPNYHQGAETLTNIEKKLSQAIRISRFIDSDLANRLQNIYENSPLLSRAAEIGISVQISEARKHTSDGVGLFTNIANQYARVLGIKKFEHYFSDEGQIPVRRMLVDVERLIPLVEEVSKIAWQKSYNDDEIFKPSNVNIEEIKIFVEQAIIAIDASTSIDAKSKKSIEEYLTEVKAELVKDTPAWKKIVGALVIISAILGGLAVAPDAVDNVNAAVRYILGTSIEEITPTRKSNSNFLPKPIDT